MTTTPVVSVDGLRKSFGDREAVRDVSFEISPGECVGLLGHNGAGKTVTIEMLEGYLARDAGSVSVLGVDPARATGAWRERIGVVLQEVEVFPTLSVTETVRMFADLYTNPRPVEQTIELVGLSDARSSRVGMLSGGRSDASTSPWGWSVTPSCCSWTSRPPGWTRPRDARRGR